MLVDTSVWVDALRGSDTPQTRKLASTLAEKGGVCICGLVLTEVLQGVRSSHERGEAQRRFALLGYLPMPRRAYLLAARIYRSARARGWTVRSTMDCLIAACAIVNGASLLQSDRDFEVLASVCSLELVEA